VTDELVPTMPGEKLLNPALIRFGADPYRVNRLAV
jgi:hypothetical protein